MCVMNLSFANTLFLPVCSNFTLEIFQINPFFPEVKIVVFFLLQNVNTDWRGAEADSDVLSRTYSMFFP